MEVPLILAPLAGYTDSPFRQICKEFGAAIVYSEMVSAAGLYYQRDNPKKLAATDRLCHFKENERPIALQLFGSNPEHFAFAVNYLVEHYRPDAIDLNFGCPVSKVIKNGAGVALMREPLRATQIVRAAVAAAGTTPIWAKFRLGIKENIAVEFGKRLAEQGASALALHARTYRQLFSGTPDYTTIALLKKAVTIPVYGNGGVRDRVSCDAMRQAGCDGIMIGQGAIGRPEIFSMRELNWLDRRQIIVEHAHLHNLFHGNLIAFRKHLAAYLRGHPRVKSIRRQLIELVEFDDLVKIMRNITS